MKRILYTLLAAAVVLAANYFFSNSTFEANLESSVTSVPTVRAQTDIPFTPVAKYDLDEVKALAGFDVREPSYLPQGVFFDHAVYQEAPTRRVTSYFRFANETLGDRGIFMELIQEPQLNATANPDACGVTNNECDSLQIGDLPVKYRLTPPTESMMWEMDGFSFQLLRTAGEPNKIYRDELLLVAGSVKGLPIVKLDGIMTELPVGELASILPDAPQVALSALNDSFTYAGTPILVKEGQMSFGEFSDLMHQTISRPPQMNVWVAIYFNENWRFNPALPEPSNTTPLPLFRGCVSVVIDLANGSPLEVSGPVSEGILPECDG